LQLREHAEIVVLGINTMHRRDFAVAIYGLNADAFARIYSIKEESPDG
jgi:hypothetical protein